MEDPYHLRRFVDAQSGVYDDVRRELTRGRKTTHWMWFVFPQLTALGHSATARHYGIDSLAEARAYLAHPVLGPRLRECAGLLRDLPARQPISQILGSVDALKLRSSMTLFLRAGEDDSHAGDLFQSVLDRYYGGEPDDSTCALLSADAG